MPLISELLARGRTFSFEFFPPKSDAESEALEATIRELEPLHPSFVSVTYRGGRSSRERTTRLVLRMERFSRITAVPHLTAIAHTRAELSEIVSGFAGAGLENLLALGGDPLPDGESADEVLYAEELVRIARDAGARCIGVAAHPAGHPRSPSLAEDRLRLRAKLELADFAVTQFFFQRDDYSRLVDELGALGMRKPVVAGIMPITNLGSVRRMAELSGYEVPTRVVERLERAGDPAEVRRVGIELACELCQDLLDDGVPGLHFYTLNRSTATREIHRRLGLG